MTRAAVEKAMDYGVNRFLADGVHYRDMVDIRAAMPNWEQWPDTWSKWAAAAEKRGEEALAEGRNLTAAGEFSRASLYYHYGQYLFFDDLALKKRVHDKKAAAFKRAAPLFAVPMERVEIPFENIKMAGYLRVPPGVKKPPVIILLGGLDTTKEDYMSVNDLCISRGLATIAFDGPGQGETFFEMPLITDFERSISAVIDFVEKRPEVDSSKVGVVGRSMGGYFGPKAAAVDDRIKALIAWCVVYDYKNFAEIERVHEHTFIGLKAVAKAKTFEEGKAFYDQFDLGPYASKIKCPTLLSHGGLDLVTPMINVTKILKDLTCPVEKLIWEDSGHCCHDRSHILRPAMADFFRKHLT